MGAKATVQRDFRKKVAARKKEQKEKAFLAATIQSRELHCRFTPSFITSMVSNTDDEYNQVTEKTNPWLLTLISNHVKHRVTLNDEKALTYPIIFLYPQHKTTDLVQACDERMFLSDLVGDMFTDRPKWDEDEEYDPVSIEVWSGNGDEEDYKLVEQEQPLYDILKEMVIVDGVVSLTVVSRRANVFY